MGSLHKHLNILDYTLASLMRRRWRNGSLLVVYTATIFLLVSVLMMGEALRQEARSVLGGSPELLVQRMQAGRHALLTPGHVEALMGIRGVRSVEGRLWGYYFDPAVGANYTIIAVERPEGIAERYGAILGKEGGPRFPIPGEGELVIGPGIERGRKLYEGDIYPFSAYSGEGLNLRVTGTLPEGTEIVSSDLMLMDARDYQRLFGTPPGHYTDAAISARNPLEYATIARKVSERLPDTRVIIRDEILRTYDAAFSWREGLIVLVMGGAALAFVIFAWDRASGLSAEERREIGILKAVGWETGDVLVMKFWEGAAISLTAYVAGVLGAWAHVFLADYALFGPVLRGWSVLYPGYRLHPHVDARVLAVLFFLTVAPYTLATVVPSWRAATVDPDSVMRQ